MERRNESDDRRKIERFTNPPVKAHFKTTHNFVNFLTALSFAAGVYHLSRGIYFGTSDTLVMGLFLAVIAFIVTTYMFRYRTAVKQYLDNESLGNLDRAMEAQASMWFVMSFLAVIYTIIYFIFR